MLNIVLLLNDTETDVLTAIGTVLTPQPSRHKCRWVSPLVLLSPALPTIQMNQSIHPFLSYTEGISFPVHCFSLQARRSESIERMEACSEA
jgi:hypothetical protein